MKTLIRPGDPPGTGHSSCGAPILTTQPKTRRVPHGELSPPQLSGNKFHSLGSLQKGQQSRHVQCGLRPVENHRHMFQPDPGCPLTSRCHCRILTHLRGSVSQTQLHELLSAIFPLLGERRGSRREGYSKRAHQKEAGGSFLTKRTLFFWAFHISIPRCTRT